MLLTSNLRTVNVIRENVLTKSSRFIRMVLCLVVFSGMSMQAIAQEPKIAVLDYGAAMLKSNKAQEMADAIKADLKADQEKILALEEQITQLTEKAERDGPVLSDAQKDSIIQEIEDKRLDYGFLVKKFKKRQKEGRDKIVQALQPQLGEVVKAVVEKGGYDMVLDRAAVVYVSKDYDITDAVVKALNKASE